VPRDFKSKRKKNIVKRRVKWGPGLRNLHFPRRQGGGGRGATLPSNIYNAFLKV